MKDLFTLITTIVGGTLATVLLVVLYVGIVAGFGFALGLGWQAAVQVWSNT